MKNGDQPISATTFRQTGDHSFRVATEKDKKEGLYLTSYSGLTKREYYAGLAMQGLCASRSEGYQVNDGFVGTNVAGDAVRIADALLAELEKQQSA